MCKGCSPALTGAERSVVISAHTGDGRASVAPEWAKSLFERFEDELSPAEKYLVEQNAEGLFYYAMWDAHSKRLSSDMCGSPFSFQGPPDAELSDLLPALYAYFDRHFE